MLIKNGSIGFLTTRIIRSLFSILVLTIIWLACRKVVERTPNSHYETQEQRSFEFDAESPDLRYILLQRRTQRTLERMKLFTEFKIVQIKQSRFRNISTEMLVLHLTNKRFRRLIVRDLQSLNKVDGYDDWRNTESIKLGNLIQRRLNYLQNPKDCLRTKKLVCSLEKYCGYGCQIHHLVYCLIVAYGLERTLVVQNQPWSYHPDGWEAVFEPITSCVLPVTNISHWPDFEALDLQLPIIDMLYPTTPYIPRIIPADIANVLKTLHGDPVAWWIGQIVKFLLKPSAKLGNTIYNATIQSGFRTPIVGIQVRRTDKIPSEAQFHSLAEYMEKVDEYYDQLELNSDVDQRTVYIATDDPSILEEAVTKYPHYQVLSHREYSEQAIEDRYSPNSLIGVILDIHFLALSDFLVCTFSSQVCRLAYEIMQTRFPDASSFYRSLDDVYYFGGGTAHLKRVHSRHTPQQSEEMVLRIGDLIDLKGNHWNGFSKGAKLKSKESGLFPSFKVDEVIETFVFPTYPEVPLDF